MSGEDGLPKAARVMVRAMNGNTELPTRRGRGVAASLIAVVAISVLGLSGCASAASSAEAATSESIAEAASAVGIAPELVYTTVVEGYDLAPQSVGRGAADGMSATWFNNSTGAMFSIRTDHGEVTAESCPSLPMWDAPDESVTCAEDDGVWHRSGGGVHEYIANRAGAMILVTGMSGAPSADLLTAATSIRIPSEAELELLFSDLPHTPPEPVERGDLPKNGDGAPIDPVGPGG